MNHLHRFYAQHAAQVWQLEGRWMVERGTFRAPSAVQWLCTKSCDLACAHCYSDAGRRAPHELTTAEALALVDQVAAVGAKTFVIAGGEPLLRRDLPQIVRYAVDKGLDWSVHTHGGKVLEHRELFEQVPAALVAVSLDGSRAVHDALRGSGSFDKAIAAIQFLVDHTPTVQVVAGTTVTRLNADSLHDLMDDVIDSRANTWGLHLFAPEGRGAAHRELLPTAGQLARVAALTRRMRRRMDVDLDNEWGSADALDPFYRDQPFLCGAGRFTCVIDPSGEILPCTTTDLAESEGNVRTDSLSEVWRDGFTRFRTTGVSSCSDGADCWLQTRNGNSCRAAAFNIDPVPVHVPELPAPRSRVGPGLRRLATAALAMSVPMIVTPAFATPDPAGFPPDFDATRWAEQLLSAEQLGGRGSDWGSVKRDVIGARAPSSTAFPVVSAALSTPSVRASALLIEALDEAESRDVWDPWLVFALWQRSTSDDRVHELYARLERHARVVDALVLAQAAVGPVHFLPWRKKSAPPPSYSGFSVPQSLLIEARRIYATTDAGTWRNEAALTVTLHRGEAVLYRQGRRVDVVRGARINLARFDVVELKGALWSDRLGVVIEGDHRVTGRGLSALLTSSARADIEADVQGALRGDAAALDRLQSILPACHDAVRRAILASPKAPGAAGLRQLLVLFDE